MCFQSAMARETVDWPESKGEKADLDHKRFGERNGKRRNC